MDTYLLIAHISLATILFFIINWIGGHSLTAGYIQMSVLVKADEAPAFNFIYRAFAPIVYITLCAAVLYQMEVEWIVKDIHYVVVYYFLIRLLFNVLTGRARLLNWGVQVSYWIISIPTAFYVYDRIILKNQYFFPSNEDLGSALWLGVLAFIYQTFNRVKLSSEKTEQRKQNYISHRFNCYKSAYGSIIDSVAKDQSQQCLIYTILIYEAFNRPKIYRWIERILFHVGLAKTLGVMQVTSDKVISDKESVQLGAQKIVDDHIKAQVMVAKKGRHHGAYSYWAIRREVIALYNRDDEYVHEVNRLYEVVADLFFPDCKNDWQKYDENHVETEDPVESCDANA